VGRFSHRAEEVRQIYAAVYAREFSTDELQQMVSFAESPAGAHYLANRFDVETDPAVQEQQAGFWEDFAPAMMQFEKDKCHEHAAQRIAAGDKNAKRALASEPETKAG